MPMKFNRKNVRNEIREIRNEAYNQSGWSKVVDKCDALIAALCADKPAPKVYTEDELEPVKTVPVAGDVMVLGDEKRVATGGGVKRGAFYASKDEWWTPFNESQDMGVYTHKDGTGWRILKRPLRCVFRDPRVGDVVRFSFDINALYKILFVDDRHVFGEGYRAESWGRDDWASLATSNHTVISRAESK